ncbi:MAG: hypothetical protein HSCHL_1193 [Hydrogenibacillus schlegelii]|uniref:Uncharacterized protein n=1 Tax=Hydrogenibacillus schlegelii TaxID=1484 RepID=A0A2T5G3F0_HYDSH|nr:hypothetical protein [Hydrogenibacillus schlegelii]PTQ50706.1 MAG: hypothetical protein HSCHL_1193 [Hydrogenibacillus schlegelii]
MAQARLEFRGIPLSAHRAYMQKLGFRPCSPPAPSPESVALPEGTDAAPDRLSASPAPSQDRAAGTERHCRDDGAAIAVREVRTLTVTAAWSIDVVVLDFEAPDAETLDEVLRAYRLLTMLSGAP